MNGTHYLWARDLGYVIGSVLAYLLPFVLLPLGGWKLWTRAGEDAKRDLAGSKVIRIFAVFLWFLALAMIVAEAQARPGELALVALIILASFLLCRFIWRTLVVKPERDSLPD